MSEFGYDDIVSAAVEQQAFEQQVEEPSFVTDEGEEYGEFDYQDEYREQPVEYQQLPLDQQQLVDEFNRVQTPEQFQKLAQDISTMATLVSNTPGAIAYRNEEAAANLASIQRGFELIDSQLDVYAEAAGGKIIDHTKARNLAEDLNQKAAIAAAREGRPYDPETLASWAMKSAAKEATGTRDYKDVVDKYTTITGGSTVQPGRRQRFPNVG